mmetsp:Transcript_11853/g.43339  ORF Transcript_11853/g.43339 Transcript_11853/m.43339 type:complete len:258 (-) Transcript_11853:465-1238(-)
MRRTLRPSPCRKHEARRRRLRLGAAGRCVVVLLEHATRQAAHEPEQHQHGARAQHHQRPSHRGAAAGGHAEVGDGELTEGGASGGADGTPSEGVGQVHGEGRQREASQRHAARARQRTQRVVLQRERHRQQPEEEGGLERVARDGPRDSRHEARVRRAGAHPLQHRGAQQRAAQRERHQRAPGLAERVGQDAAAEAEDEAAGDLHRRGGQAQHGPRHEERREARVHRRARPRRRRVLLQGAQPVAALDEWLLELGQQ